MKLPSFINWSNFWMLLLAIWATSYVINSIIKSFHD